MPAPMLAAGNLKFLLKGEKLQGRYALVKLKERRVPAPRRRRAQLAAHQGARRRGAARGRARHHGGARRERRDAADDGADRRRPDARLALEPRAGRARRRAGRAPRSRPRGCASAARGRAASAARGAGLAARDADRRAPAARARRLNGTCELFDEAAGAPLAPAAAAHAPPSPTPCACCRRQTLVVDGVVTALHPTARRARAPRRGARGRRARATLAYYLTDLLFLDGHDLARDAARAPQGAARRARRARAPPGVLRSLDHFEGDGAAFFREACRLGLPGMVSRRADAPTPAPRRLPSP